MAVEKSLQMRKNQALALARARRRRQESEQEQGGLITGEEAATAVGRGVAGLISFPKEVSDLVGKGGQFVGEQLRTLTGKEPLPEGTKIQPPIPSPIDLLPDYRQVYGAMKKLGLPDKEAQSVSGQYQQTILEFMAGNPSRKAITTMANIVSGIGSEAAGQQTKGTELEPYARIGGAILGGGLTELPASMRSTPGEIVQESLEGIPQAEIERGLELQRAGQEIGVPLTGAEAIESPGLQRLAGDVAASPRGQAIMEGFLRRRATRDALPGQVERAARLEMEGISPSVVPESVAQKAEKAATEAIEAAEESRTAAVTEYYKKAGRVPISLDIINPILARINREIAQATSPELRNTLRSMKKEINRAAIKKPVRTAEGVKTRKFTGNIQLTKLDNIRKDFRDKIKQQQFGEKAIPKNAAKKVNAILADIRKTLTRHSEEFVRGNEIYQRISEEVVNPLMASGIGRIAGKGFDAQSVPKVERMLVALSNYKEVRPETVKKLAEELNQIDKAIFPEMTRVLLDVEFDKAAKDLMAGPQRNVGAKFRQAIYGTPQQKKNLQEIIKQTAKAQGINPKSLWRGFDRMLSVFERTGRIPAFGSATQPRQQLASEMRASKLAGAMEAISAAPLATPAQKIRNFLMSGRYRELANILVAPDSVEQLIELAKTKPNTRKARALVSSLLAIAREGAQAEGIE